GRALLHLRGFLALLPARTRAAGDPGGAHRRHLGGGGGVPSRAACRAVVAGVGGAAGWLRLCLDLAHDHRAQSSGDLHLPGLVAARRPAAGVARRDGAARGGTAAKRAV
ncbi:MAG: hypothetical protein AVDCRST_MAG08-3981, partial [uncultured Acetobacteraceae bacterium]